MPDPYLLAVAALVAAALAAVASWSLGPSRIPGGAAGVGLAVLAGAWILRLGPRIPPLEALDRLLIVLIPAAVASEAAVRKWPAAGWVPRLAASAMAAPVLVHGSSYVADLSGPGSREWGLGHTSAIYAGLAGILFLALEASGRLSARAPRTMAAALAVSAAGAGLTLMLSGYATGGQLGVPLAAAAAVFAVRGDERDCAAVRVAVIVLFSLLVIGGLFAGLSAANAALLLAAPLLCWAGELPRFRGLGPGAKSAVRLAPASLAVTLAVLLALRKFEADSSRGSDRSWEADAGISLHLGVGRGVNPRRRG
ncbi:hypothetical protein OJF2_28840 [Aquisphaera giovannonii]|uniref:Uncharacterized protein n=1 Tax=Aquisphaera giovannonii TaxID=406548 RepID=A0A5B9W2C2_9BACT|nr:hypothetical protein [Aquisphaera giovannonii]QEH34347.1 hypothetical protein OJF2_28840 [Aquisphaera giovannonii]